MKNKRSNGTLIRFLVCVLSLPTVAMLMYGTVFGSLEAAAPYLLTGAALGVLHIIVRPILRVLFAPLGCLTLGLAGTGIDVALIYIASRFVGGFYMPSFWYALINALLINAVVGAIGAKKR